MRNKTAFAVILALFAAAMSLQAQSLKDNEYYQKSLALKAQAEQAFDEGDYDAAADYAAQASENARLSDEYVAKMVAKAEADRAIAAAKERIAWADSVGAEKGYPAECAAAKAGLEAALAAYDKEEYPEARDLARGALAALASVSGATPLPATYVVRLIPARRDCLWRIAEYPFIYNNPLKWPVIYEANKKTFRDPSNPNLIYPGQVLQIPSIKGETRSGAYDPSKTYTPLPKK